MDLVLIWLLQVFRQVRLHIEANLLNEPEDNFIRGCQHLFLDTNLGDHNRFLVSVDPQKYLKTYSLSSSPLVTAKGSFET